MSILTFKRGASRVIEIQISVEQATELEMLLRLLGTMRELPMLASREKLSAFARSPTLDSIETAIDRKVRQYADVREIFLKRLSLQSPALKKPFVYFAQN